MLIYNPEERVSPYELVTNHPYLRTPSDGTKATMDTADGGPVAPNTSGTADTTNGTNDSLLVSQSQALLQPDGVQSEKGKVR